MSHPLADIINAKIKTDTRAPKLRNLASAGSGRKRTTIVGATVKSITQAQVDNAGLTVWGVLKQQPMTRSMFRQGALADCYLLSSAIALTLDNPNWSDDIILPIDPRAVIVQYFYKGEIVQITTTLEVSTSYNNPSDDDVRVELLEKTYGLLRTGISDYQKAAWGNGFEAAQALGRQTATIATQTPAGFDGARAAGKGILAITGANATKITARHAVCFLNGTTRIDPWDGSTNVYTPPEVITDRTQIAAAYAITTPTPKILTKPSTPMTPAPVPMPPAVPVTPAPTPEPEKPTMPTLEPTGLITIENGRVVWAWSGAASATVNGKLVAATGSMDLDGSEKYDLVLLDASGKVIPGKWFTAWAPKPTTPKPPEQDELLSCTVMVTRTWKIKGVVVSTA